MPKKIKVTTYKPFAKEAVARMKEIVETAGYEFEIFENYSEKEELLEAVKDVNALIVRSDKITKEVIDNAPNLEIVVRGGAGYDNVDTNYAAEKDIIVMNTPGQNSNAVAELTFGMMLYMLRNQFQPAAGNELRFKTLGVHGFGHVGKNIARIAKGFDMDIYAYDPFLSDEDFEEEGVKKCETVEELYKTCRFISLNIPDNEKTKGTINYDLMSLMPKDAMLVNAARKPIINEDDLLKIMDEREDFTFIADVAPDCKDVFAEKFVNRYFFTPKKMGAQTLEANINAAEAAATQIVNYFKKGEIVNKVN